MLLPVHPAELGRIVGHQKSADQQIICTSTGSTGDLLICTFLVTKGFINVYWDGLKVH